MHIHYFVSEDSFEAFEGCIPSIISSGLWYRLSLSMIPNKFSAFFLSCKVVRVGCQLNEKKGHTSSEGLYF